MSLQAGQSLSHYEILTPLGTGAMGEVWGARDTRLNREVALKVLPAEFASDEDRLRRFEREARALASLNHPHVAQVFGFDEAGGIAFLAMELVPGQDLSQHMAGRALSLDETLDIARQIAAGLEAAHEAGVVHRDLKPANVRLTPDGVVKLIDFGLAKEVGARAGRDSTSAEPDSVLVTEEGLVLGTPVYMSPEQARGQPVDRRTDLWALGCVLFECLSGRRAFGGRSAGDVLAAILKEEPDWSALPDLPPRVDELLRRCLEKDARMRLRDAGEARVQLELAAAGDAGDRVAGATSGKRGSLSPIAAVSLVLVSLLAGVGLAKLLTPSMEPSELAITEQATSAPPPQAGPLQFSIHTFTQTSSRTALALSPSGDAAVWIEDRSLWVRRLDAWEPRLLASDIGTASRLAWSPEGDEIAYSIENEIWRVPLSGAPPQRVVDLGNPGLSSLCWLPDGRLADAGSDGLRVRSAETGVAEVLAGIPEGADFHLDGLVVLDGGGLLSIRHDADGTRDTLVRNVNGQLEEVIRYQGRELNELARRGDGLMLLTADDGNSRWWWTPLGPDGPGAELTFTPFDKSATSFAQNGTVAWIETEGLSQSRLARVSEDGSLNPFGREHEGFVMPGSASDGRRQLYSVVDPAGVNSALWAYDYDRGASTFLANCKGPVPFLHPLDDGSFLASVAVPQSTLRFPAHGGEPQVVREEFTLAATPDGSVVLYLPKLGDDGPLMWDDLTDDLPERPFKESLEFTGPGCCSVSPDGRWALYTSKVSGQSQVYLASLPPTGEEWQVSLDGAGFGCFGIPGDDAIYLANGRLFDDIQAEAWRVSFEREPEVRLGTPEPLPLSEDAVFAVRGIDSVTGDLLGSLTRRPDSSQVRVQIGWEPEAH